MNGKSAANRQFEVEHNTQESAHTVQSASARSAQQVAPAPEEPNQKTVVLTDKLAQEVLRKLQLATELESKDDREIVCSEIFADVSGLADARACVKLKVPTGARFYEVLAFYFDQHPDRAEEVLSLCRRLWGQPYIAPVYGLLLHRWLLLHTSAGGQEQRQKHVNVLISGARQLLWGDVQSFNRHFQPLHEFLAKHVVFSKDQSELLDSLPIQSRTAVLSVVASLLPYYNIPQGFRWAAENMPVPGHTKSHEPGESTDFVLTEVTDTLSKMKSQHSLQKYLEVLLCLAESPHLATVRTITKLRLQAELYGLTSAGGPRYLSRDVNQAAFRALDHLFPYGRRSRRLVNIAFRFLHPTEGLWLIYFAVRSSIETWTAWVKSCCMAVCRTASNLNPLHALTRRCKQQRA